MLTVLPREALKSSVVPWNAAIDSVPFSSLLLSLFILLRISWAESISHLFQPSILPIRRSGTHGIWLSSAQQECNTKDEW